MPAAGPLGAQAKPERGLFRLLGPAFVAAIAYVDPGNVAANLSAGAKYGYLLVWVLVLANAMAVVVQYLSAKLGLVTGRSMPEMLGERMPRAARLAYWVQAEGIAIATDLAEVIGGALALYILFDLPLLLGGVIVGGVSMAILSLQRTGQLRFERVIMGLLAIITFGFVAGLFVSPLDWGGIASGLVPRFAPRRSCSPRACSERPSCPTRSICTRRSPATGTASNAIPSASPACCGPPAGTSCSRSWSRAV